MFLNLLFSFSESNLFTHFVFRKVRCLVEFSQVLNRPLVTDHRKVDRHFLIYSKILFARISRKFDLQKDTLCSDLTEVWSTVRYPLLRSHESLIYSKIPFDLTSLHRGDWITAFASTLLRDCSPLCKENYFFIKQKYLIVLTMLISVLSEDKVSGLEQWEGLGGGSFT